MKNVKRKSVLFVVAFLVWCLFNWRPDWQHMAIGVLVALFVAVMTGDLFVERPRLLKNPKRYVCFVFVYMPLFIWQFVKAAVEVAFRILHPKLRIRPGIVRVKTSLSSDLGLSFLANTITLTGGTMTVDVDKQNKILYVHWIDVQAQDPETATRMIVSRFEGVLKKIFD